MIGTLRHEVLDRLLIVNQQHLRRVLTEYLMQHKTARPHRALGHVSTAQPEARSPEPFNLAEVRICRKQILDRLIHEYHVPPDCPQAPRIAFRSPIR